MRLGIYMDLRNPPADQVPWPEFYARRLQRVADAESAGIGALWVSEHHMYEDGYLPQPLTFLAAAAARTTRMRLGTAVVVAPLRPSLQIAEEAAIVDLISGGRLELGLGAGYQRREFDAYGIDIGRRYELLEERAREVRRMWDDGTCQPPPAQARPPLWLGVMGPRGARIAGRLGEGLLWIRPNLMEPYLAGLAEGGHAESDARLGGLLFLVLADDPEAAKARLAPHVLYQRQSYNRYSSERENGTGAERFSHPTNDPAKAPDPDKLFDERLDRLPLSARLRVMTPDAAVALLRRELPRLPVEHVFVWDSVGAMPDDLAERHLELCATHLVPALAHLGNESG